MKNPDWKNREKVIAIIEKHLGQSANVQHNVNLPVLKITKFDINQN